MTDKLTSAILLYTLLFAFMVGYVIVWPEDITNWPRYTLIMGYIGIVVGMLWMLPGVENSPEI